MLWLARFAVYTSLCLGIKNYSFMLCGTYWKMFLTGIGTLWTNLCLSSDERTAVGRKKLWKEGQECLENNRFEGFFFFCSCTAPLGALPIFWGHNNVVCITPSHIAGVPEVVTPKSDRLDESEITWYEIWKIQNLLWCGFLCDWC